MKEVAKINRERKYKYMSQKINDFEFLLSSGSVNFPCSILLHELQDSFKRAALFLQFID